MPLPLIPAVIAGSALLQNGINAASQGSMNRKSRQWNEKMYNQQRLHSLQDWNMMNHYNSPAQQMQRLKDAGLNPNLVYENGATQSASPVRSSNVEGWNPRAAPIDLAGVGNGLMSFYDMEMKQAQIDNLKVQNDVATQDALLRAAQTLQTVAQTGQIKTTTARGQFDLDLANELRGYSVEAARESVRKTQAETQMLTDSNERQAALNGQTLLESAERVLNLRAQRAKTDDERRAIEQQIKNLRSDNTLKELDIEIKRMGIQPSDNLIWRILGRTIGDWKNVEKTAPHMKNALPKMIYPFGN